MKKFVELFESITELEKTISNVIIPNSSKILPDIDQSIRSIFINHLLESKSSRTPQVTAIVSLEIAKKMLESKATIGIVVRENYNQLFGMLKSGKVHTSTHGKKYFPNTKNIIEQAEKISKDNNLELEVLIIS